MELGVLLDVIISPRDRLFEAIVVRCSIVNMSPPAPVYVKATCHSFHLQEFISRLQMSDLCAPCDQGAGLDKLTQRFDKVETILLDEITSVTEVILQERQHQSYLDEDFHNARK